MHRQLLLVALSCLVFLRPSLAAAEYIFTPVDVPGSTATNLYSINDRGQIVGSFTDSSGTHGFLRSNGQFTTVDAPAATYTVAHGINNTGRIVGTYRDNAGRFHGFLLAGSQFTTIDPPNSNQTDLLGINDLGQIIGSFSPGGQFLFTHGQFVTLTPGAFQYSELHGINSRGQIVGVMGPGEPEEDRGFRLEARGDIATLAFPGSDIHERKWDQHARRGRGSHGWRAARREVTGFSPCLWHLHLDRGSRFRGDLSVCDQ